MISIDLNMDVGEGMNNESRLFPYISSCNIACGGHAGDEGSIRKVIELANKFEVKIGAHPSFPDKENFGRVAMDISSKELRNSIVKQLRLFASIASEYNIEVHHVKAHGALYNLAVGNQEMADLVVKATQEVLNVPIYAPFNSEMAHKAKALGTKVIFEAFADRNYNDDLTLVSRSKPDALIHDADAMLKHVLEILQSSRVTTVNGRSRPLKANTFCIHSDTQNSEILVKNLYESLIGLGIKVVSA